MSILWFLFAIIACLAGAAGGAFGMRWWAERQREIADQEDPRDTEIRDLQVKLKVARNDADRSTEVAAGLREHLDLAHARIGELLGRIAAAGQKYRTCKDVLKNEIRQKNGLRDQLDALRRQHEALTTRAQEMEIELSLQQAPEALPDPVSGGDGNVADETDAAGFPALDTPDIADDSPSLIQSLTDELERWRRHCRVLGDELKQRRNLPAAGDSGLAAMPADELTAIRGIGSIMERKLHELGIYRFRDLAGIETADSAHPILGAPVIRSRMRRYGWAEQARELHRRKYGEGL